MKILIAHWRPDIVSGAELAISDMVLKRSNDIYYIMITPGEGKLAEYYRERGFTVWPMRIESPRRLYPGLHLFQSIRFARKLRREGVDIVLCNTFPAASRMATACRMSGIPMVMYVREYVRNVPTHRRLLRKAALTLAASEDVADYVKGLSPNSRITVAYDHLDAVPLVKRVTAHQTAGNRLLPFPIDSPVIGIIGRITTYKQQDLFLRAIPFVLEEFRNARFVVVGSPTKKEREYERTLHKIVGDLGIEDVIAFMGQRRDAVEIISELKVCCMTSDREPFPRTVLEAQAVGCAVVASNTGGCPEMVEDGVTGLLFNVTAGDSPRQLANQIIRLLKDPEFARTLTVRAQKRVINGFGSFQSVEDELRNLSKGSQIC
jgi:glycosyltransferase involved in cell wall biosynthesis